MNQHLQTATAASAANASAAREAASVSAASGLEDQPKAQPARAMDDCIDCGNSNVDPSLIKKANFDGFNNLQVLQWFGPKNCVNSDFRQEMICNGRGYNDVRVPIGPNTALQPFGSR